ncbi:hypothetical protein ALT1644_30046 [Alteromonas macleodii]
MLSRGICTQSFALAAEETNAVQATTEAARRIPFSITNPYFYNIVNTFCATGSIMVFICSYVNGIIYIF